MWKMSAAQPSFTCSKSTVETLEQFVNTVYNKDIGMRPLTSL